MKQNILPDFKKITVLRENRLAVSRVRAGEVSKITEGDQKVQTSSYKINKSWGCHVQYGDWSQKC